MENAAGYMAGFAGSACGCTQVTLAVVTAGEALDAAVDASFAAGDTRGAWLLDAFGSEAVEAVADTLDALLREKHGEGTRRFSPGYGNLPVTENVRILAELGVDFAAAHPASGMLIPRKSVVFLIGWNRSDRAG
jgi:cobalamin-dependent methionine synthase I